MGDGRGWWEGGWAGATRTEHVPRRELRLDQRANPHVCTTVIPTNVRSMYAHGVAGGA